MGCSGDKCECGGACGCGPNRRGRSVQPLRTTRDYGEATADGATKTAAGTSNWKTIIKGRLGTFAFTMGQRSRLGSLPDDQLKRIKRILENVYKSAPSGRSRGSDNRPYSKVFRYHSLKWNVDYYHDGSIISIRLSDGEMSKLVAMTTVSKRKFRRDHGDPEKMRGDEATSRAFSAAAELVAVARDLTGASEWDGDAVDDALKIIGRLAKGVARSNGKARRHLDNAYRSLQRADELVMEEED